MSDDERPDLSALAKIPGVPDPSKAVPRDPVSGYDLAAYVAVAARLAEHREPRPTVLAAYGLDDMRWLEIEKTWLLRLGISALKQDLSLIEEYDRLYVAAQDALGSTEPTRSLDEYAKILAELTIGRDPTEVFSAAKLSIADWSRLQRAWTRRMVNDLEISKAMRAMLDAHVNALRAAR